MQNVSTGARHFAKAIKTMNESQRDAATRIAITEGFLSLILSGQRTPSLSVACRIEREYGIPASDFAECA